MVYINLEKQNFSLYEERWVSIKFITCLVLWKKVNVMHILSLVLHWYSIHSTLVLLLILSLVQQSRARTYVYNIWREKYMYMCMNKLFYFLPHIYPTEIMQIYSIYLLLICRFSTRNYTLNGWIGCRQYIKLCAWFILPMSFKLNEKQNVWKINWKTSSALMRSNLLVLLLHYNVWISILNLKSF